MEKAILKTLIYADLFEYSLKAYEIHKWLIGKSATLIQVEKALIRLTQKRKIKSKSDHFFLPGREKLVRARQTREKQSSNFFLKAKLCSWFLKIIPTLKLVGISGGLALKNAEKEDDIDLFLITEKNRIWLTRLFVIFVLDILGVRRKAKMTSKKAAGKICINILLEEDKLEQENKDLFIAHEVLQMKVLWQRGNIYTKYLKDNNWAFEFLSNWIGPSVSEGDRLPAKIKYLGGTRAGKRKSNFLVENLAEKFQLWLMKKPQGLERIKEGALYFHPNDIRSKVLMEFRKRVKNLSST